MKNKRHTTNYFCLRIWKTGNASETDRKPFDTTYPPQFVAFSEATLPFSCVVLYAFFVARSFCSRWTKIQTEIEIERIAIKKNQIVPAIWNNDIRLIKYYAILINNILFLHDWLELEEYRVNDCFRFQSLLISSIHSVFKQHISFVGMKKKKKTQSEIMQMSIEQPNSDKIASFRNHYPFRLWLVWNEIKPKSIFSTKLHTQTEMLATAFLCFNV